MWFQLSDTDMVSHHQGKIGPDDFQRVPCDAVLAEWYGFRGVIWFELAPISHHQDRIGRDAFQCFPNNAVLAE